MPQAHLTASTAALVQNVRSFTVSQDHLSQEPVLLPVLIPDRRRSSLTAGSPRQDQLPGSGTAAVRRSLPVQSVPAVPESGPLPEQPAEPVLPDLPEQSPWTDYKLSLIHI